MQAEEIAWVGAGADGFVRLIDQTLLDRLIDVADPGLVHSVAQRRCGDCERERVFQPRETTTIFGMEEIDCQAVSRCRGFHEDIGAGAGEGIGRSAPPRPERLNDKAQ